MRRRPVNSSGSAKWPSSPHSCTAFPRPSGYRPAQIKPESFHDQGNVRGRWELEQRARPGNCCQLWYVDAKDGRRLESCPVSSGLRASTPRSVYTYSKSSSLAGRERPAGGWAITVSGGLRRHTGTLAQHAA